MATKIPEFSYTGTYSTEIKNGYWYIYLKSSGTIKFSYAKTIDTFLVGGGAGGGAGGGGNGYNPSTKEKAQSGSANTGGGGGGGDIGAGVASAAGGSGIVILRGTQDDALPIIFNGTQISQLIYNGTTVSSVIYNGTKLF